MLLCDLPDDVLIHVLRVSCIDKDPYGDLNDNLPLLAISRRLRRLALPAVYRTAYLSFYEEPSIDSTDDSSSTIDESLSLIADAGCVGLVRAVSVAVCRATETTWALREAAKEIRSSASIWPRVESLSINAMDSEIDHRDIDDRHISEVRGRTRDGSRSAAGALSSLFPRVRRLSFFGEDEGNIIALYYKQLTSRYSEQLEELRYDYRIWLPQDIHLQRLRRVCFACDAMNDNEFPRINPETVEEMCIYHAPPSLDLGTFGASEDSLDIVFPKLRRLKLLYSDISNSNMQIARQNSPAWRLHLPQVRVIHLRCDRDRCPFIEDAVLPADVDSFSIGGNTALLTAVAAMPLPTTQDLELEVVQDPYNTRGVLAAVNTILSSMRPRKKATLHISAEGLRVLPEDITFTGLTELHIASPTSVRTVIGLVQKLPQLVRLHISNYTLHDIPSDVATLTPDEHELLPPFDTKIETLGLSGIRRGLHSKQDSRVWQYMLLRMPLLTGANLYGVSHQELGDFVANYSQRYPHLSSIRMSNK